MGAPAARLWVRRAKNSTPQQLEGECFAPAGGGPGRHYGFHAAAPTAAFDPKITALWIEALASELDQHHGAFYGFAANKLRERLGKHASSAQHDETQPSSELAHLIGTAIGRSSIQQALEQQRALYADLATGTRTVPLTKLHGSVSACHAGGPYYLRGRDFSTFLDSSALVDSWGTPALDLLDGQLSDRNLRTRYETATSHSFGPSVVEELAVVGSDPSLVEGSDLTLLFKVKSSLLLDGALRESLGTFGSAHPGIDTHQVKYEGADITVTRSGDGGVHRQRASVAGLELVSNSPASIRRVISAIHGKTARLADEPDFAYMLARDADRDAPLLGFAGDSFVASVVGPQQKIKAAERELAFAEASRPGYAALLYGLLSGHSPSSAKDLLDAKLLSAHTAEGLSYVFGQTACVIRCLPRRLRPRGRRCPYPAHPWQTS